MTLEPVLPLWILIALAVVLIALRLAALRRLLGTADPAGLRSAVLRWSGVTLASLLLLGAAMRPGVTIGEAVPAWATPASASAPVNVFFVVDRSADSRVEDLTDGAPRIARIRNDISALIDQYAGAQFAVISFASNATLDWPLSDDVWSLKPLIAGLSTFGGPAGAMYQVNAAAAGEILHTQLAQAIQRSPGCTNLVFYFGEGAGGSRAPQGSFDLDPGTVAGGAVFGYGTTTGGPIPERIDNGRVVYADDPQTGVALISAIDEPALRTVAEQLGVPYVHRQNAESITAVPAISSQIGGAHMNSATPRVIELYWVLALVAAALVLLEIGLTIWRFRRRRAVRVDTAS